MFIASNFFNEFINVLDFRYLAHGTATDYMFDVVRVPMSFTFEVCKMQTLSAEFLNAGLYYLCA